MDHPSLFSNLPSEIIINIICRLPIKTITCCKCLNKSWLQLLQTPEFVMPHLSKSLPGIATYQGDLIKIFELVDELELASHELHYSLIAEVNMKEFMSPRHNKIIGSFDGLLLVLSQTETNQEGLYLGNPITREHIVLPEIGEGCVSFPDIVTFGFGISKKSGLYKVVRIFQECRHDPRRKPLREQIPPRTLLLSTNPRSECRVYTLGGGTWRSIAPDSSREYSSYITGTFLDGKLHWLVRDSKDAWSISCFNLETEQFSLFSPPADVRGQLVSLTAFENVLCVCDNNSETEIVTWTMKKYGVEKSWSKEFVFSKVSGFFGYECYDLVYPLKMFKDGDILMWWGDHYPFYYSSEPKSCAEIDSLGLERYSHTMPLLHVPSFVSLKSFEIEDIRSF